MKKSITKKIISLLLCTCLLFSLSVISFAADSQKKAIDFVALIETTGHASSYIETVKTQLLSEIKKIDTSLVDYRLAIVEYRDFTERTNIADFAYKSSGFLTSIKSIEDYFDEITLSSFSNSSTCLFCTFYDCVKNLAFRDKCARGILVFGSTKCDNPEPYTGYNFSDVYYAFDLIASGDASECVNPIFSFNLGSSTELANVYTNLSNYSGGTYNIFSPLSSTFEHDLAVAIGSALNYVIDNVEIIEDKPQEDYFAQKLEKILKTLPPVIKEIATPIFRLMIVLYNLLH